MTAPAKKIAHVADFLPAGWLAKDDKGKVVTRAATCECGESYKQSMLNPEFIDASPRVAQQFVRHIPDGWVPIYCPKCERLDLQRIANMRGSLRDLPDRKDWA